MSLQKPKSRPLPKRPTIPGDSPGAAVWPRVEFLASIALSLWVLLLHGLFLFHAGPLWRDEVGTVDFATMPTLSDIWHHLQYDNFPPLFVGLARVWTRVAGSGDFNFRLLGFLIGLGTLGVFWYSALRCGARAPLLVLALYGVNPLAVRVGDSMRPYGLGFALNLLALTLIWKFVENPRPRSWFWATLALVLSVQCLYHNAVFLAAFCLAGGAVTLARRQWRTAAQVAGMGAVSALSLLPHLGNIMKGRDWLGVAWHPVGWEELGKMPAIALRASGSWMVWFWPGLALLALGTAFILAIRSRTWRMGFFAIVLLGSTLLYGVFLDRIAIQLRSWYFLILLAPAALSVDIILAAPAVPRMRLGRAGLALLLAAASIPACFAAVQVRQSNADLVAQTLRIRRQAGDLILVSPWYYGVALQRYYTNHFDTLPPMSSEDLRIHRYDLMKKQMMAENPVGPLLEQARQTLRSGQDLWVVGDFQFPPPGRPQPILPPYREGMVFDVPAAHYWSSWLFQFSQMIQDHATSLEQPDPSIAGGAAVSPLENIRVYVFHGWKE